MGAMERVVEERLSWAARAILLVALIKVAAALAGLATPTQGPSGPAAWPVRGVDALHILAFGGVGAWLLWASRLRPGAGELGGFLLLVGCTYTKRPLRDLVSALPEGLAGAVSLLSWLAADAFMAYFLWAFVGGFPPSSGAPPAPVRWIRRLSWAGGVFLLVATATSSPLLSTALPRLHAALRPYSWGAPGGFFWRFVLGLSTLAIPYLVAKVRRTEGSDRGRLTLFTLAFVAGFAPLFLDSLAQLLVPGYDLTKPRWLGQVVLVVFLTTPVTTAWAVIVKGVVDVRLVARQALGYALARGTIVVAAAVPLVGLVLYLYDNRRLPLAELLSGKRPIVLLAALALSLAALAARRRLLTAIDRRFFREQVDAGRILTALAERSRRAASSEELAALLELEVERALHVETAAFLVADPLAGSYVSRDSRIESLGAGSALAGLLTGVSDPLDVDLSRTDGPVSRLPANERQWLSSARVRLLVPFVASDGSILGILALGAKRSELPFTREDRSLLAAIAGSGAVGLENRILRSTPGRSSAGRPVPPDREEPEAPSEARASECETCGRIYPPATATCRCGGVTSDARVPYVLLGKFRVEGRLGAGGMGVVYRARDIALGRPVALKTLPRVTAEYAMRLRREARAVASLVHPNIAVIYGAETWRDVPVLVFELLGGGTLADRLGGGPLAPARVVDLGLVLADVLSTAHGRGLLHRDIKPSNIGFTEEGVPKLLDFGLARILHDGRRESAFADEGELPDASRVATSPLTLQSMAADGGKGYVVGTPAYMSPEAVRGESPDESVDLWSTGVVLYESATGRNPFLRPSLWETLRAIRREDAPDPREVSPGLSEPLATLLLELLSRERAARPAGAAQLRSRLAVLSPRET